MASPSTWFSRWGIVVVCIIFAGIVINAVIPKTGYNGGGGSVTLDYSEASIEKVEGILSKIYDSIPRGFLSKLTKKAPTPQELDRIGYMFGGYIAEVIKRQFGGRWKMDSSLYPGQKVLTFEPASGGELWPQMKVGKRLANGPEDNVWHYYQALRERFHKKT